MAVKKPKPKTKKKTAKKLSAKALLFCKEYLVDLNATKAAERAGYSHKTAQEQSSRLLLNVMVKAEIDRLKTIRANKVEVNSEDVLRELVRLSSSDIRQVFDEDGSLKPMSEWPDAIARCVASVEVEELFEMQPKENGRGMDKVQIGWTKKVKFWDKNKSLDMLGRHLKLFNNDDANKGPQVIVIDRVDAKNAFA